MGYCCLFLVFLLYKCVSCSNDSQDLTKKMDNLLTKFDQIEHENRALRDDNVNLHQSIKQLAYQVNELQKKISTVKPCDSDGPQACIHDVVENYITSSKGKRMLLNNMVPQESTELVAFSATLNHEVTLGTQQIIEYDNVITNLGHGYDARHGHFIAPVKGLYIVSITGYNPPAIMAFLELVQNGKFIVSLFSDGRGGGQSGLTETLFLQLEKGDMLWVRSHQPGGKLYGSPTENCNSFSGHLLQTL